MTASSTDSGNSKNDHQIRTLATGSQRALPWLFPTVVFWAVLFIRASDFWGKEGYYFLSWLVPPLGVYFLYTRLRDQPEPDAGWRGAPFFAFLAGLGAVFFFFIGQTMPFWRPLLYLQAMCTVLTVFLLIGASHGRSGALHFLPLWVVLLIALPWPARQEASAIYWLTDRVTELTETTLNLIGYPATHTGNRIEVQGHIVEVGDACSGLRSFQGLLMIGVVIGELYRLRLSRILLVVMAFFVSFPLNVIRAAALSLILLGAGEDSYAWWHDPLGGIVYATGCLILVSFSSLLSGRSRPPPARAGEPLLGLPLLKNSGWQFASVFLCLVLVGEGWFRYGNEKPKIEEGWAFDYDALREQYQVEKIPLEPEVYELLQSDTGSHHSIMGESGYIADVFDFGYRANIQGMMAAEYHTPEVCMGKYGGLELREMRPGLIWSTADRRIHVTGYSFAAPTGSLIYAFQGVWLAGNGYDGAARYDSLVRRKDGALVRLDIAFRRFRLGQRRFDVQIFLLATPDASNLDEAWTECQNLLDRLQSLSPESTPAS